MKERTQGSSLVFRWDDSEEYWRGFGLGTHLVWMMDLYLVENLGPSMAWKWAARLGGKMEQRMDNQ